MKSRDLNLLPILERLIETQSLTTTGKDLSLSVPTVSRSLARLRADYGDELLVRSGRGMKATPRAKAMYPALKKHLNGLDSTFLIPEQTPIGEVVRSFRIRCDDVFAGVMAQHLSRLLTEQAPGINVELVSEVASTDIAVREGSIDLEIGGRSSFPPDVVVRKLGQQSVVALMKEDHPLTTRNKSSKLLFGYPHVLAENQIGHERELLAALKALKLERSTRIIVPSYYAAAAVVSQSLMIATLPEVMARHLVKLHRLVVAPLPIKLQPISASISWHSEHRKDPVHMWLRDQLAGIVSAEISTKHRDRSH